jgi:hypothetical protein
MLPLPGLPQRGDWFPNKFFEKYLFIFSIELNASSQCIFPSCFYEIIAKIAPILNFHDTSSIHVD